MLAVQVWLPLVRIESVFAFQIWYCEHCVKKPMKGRQKALFWFLLLFSLDFCQLNVSCKFGLATFWLFPSHCRKFKPSLSLFLTIEEKQWMHLSFSLSARFEQLNTTQKTWHFQILISFSLFYYLWQSIYSPAFFSTAVFSCPP